MQDYQAKNTSADRPASRIDNDVNTLKNVVERVETITHRIIRHARTLGYFEPPKDAAVSAPTPVVTTLADALSRIDNDVNTLKNVVERVETITHRIIRHARTLGYFEPPKDAAVSAPTPVVTTLADALTALDRAVDHCSGSLNVFD